MHPTGPDTITVVPMRLMPEIVARHNAGRIVSVINAHLMPATPPGFPPRHHLKLATSDAAAADAKGREAMARQIEDLIRFAIDWDRQSPMVVHCFSGLNRSPAASFIMLCALNPDTPEPLIALLLRQASDTAAPHRQMVAMADQILGRKGRMTGAMDVIGPGIPSAEARPFSLIATIASEGAGAAALPAPAAASRAPASPASPDRGRLE